MRGSDPGLSPLGGKGVGLIAEIAVISMVGGVIKQNAVQRSRTACPAQAPPAAGAWRSEADHR